MMSSLRNPGQMPQSDRELLSELASAEDEEVMSEKDNVAVACGQGQASF